MSGRLIRVAMLGVVALAEVSGQSTGGQASGPRLRIHAVAVDRQGIPVTDLRREDLEVWIGTYRVPIDSLTPVTSTSERGGRVIVLLLDDLVLDPTMAPRVRDIARRFISRMSPGDQMAVVTVDGGGMEITDDPARLQRRADAYFGGMRILQPDLVGEQVLRSVASVSRQLLEAPGKKTIVAIGVAWLFDRPIPPPTVARDLRQEWVEAVRAMAAADVHFYVIDPEGVGRSRADTGLTGFAYETGGRAFTNTNDFDGAVNQILREAGHFYVIDVADPPVFRKSDLRELDVRVLRKGVTVRARRWIPGSTSPER
jgi:VWFA-related protein